MIQVGTTLNVIDNSGAKKVYCIRIIKGSNKRYAYLGDSILVVVKTLRKKRRVLSKVKKGEIHRIENKSKKDLIMIEVQTGEYLEEDDIKRFKDIYKR